MESRWDRVGFISKMKSRIAMLLGSSVALVNTAVAVPTSSQTTPADETTLTRVGSPAVKQLPPQLILKQTRAGFKMIAGHTSHSSHSSHASHSSHSSHSSHTSHTSSAM